SAMLDRRKQETPATVIVIEALSGILPDHTYVTELRVEGNRLQVIGVTQDAPGLIRLIEQSPHFTRATFFAPTTRAPTDPAERFHTEARIDPVNPPRSCPRDAVYRFLARNPAVGATAYVGLVVVLGIVAWMATADLIDQRQAVAQAEDLLAQLERGRTN